MYQKHILISFFFCFNLPFFLLLLSLLSLLSLFCFNWVVTVLALCIQCAVHPSAPEPHWVQGQRLCLHVSAPSHHWAGLCTPCWHQTARQRATYEGVTMTLWLELHAFNGRMGNAPISMVFHALSSQMLGQRVCFFPPPSLPLGFSFVDTQDWGEENRFNFLFLTLLALIIVSFVK